MAIGRLGGYFDNNRKFATGISSKNSTAYFKLNNASYYEKDSIKITGLDFVPSFGFVYVNDTEGLMLFSTKGHPWGNVLYIGGDIWSWNNGDGNFEIPVFSPQQFIWTVFE